MIGAAVMFIVLLWKWGLWLYRLPLADKKRILFGLSLIHISEPTRPY